MIKCFHFQFIVGIVYAYSIGPYVSYLTFQYLCLVIPVIFVVAFAFIPDSPHYYMSQRNRQKANASLAYLRGKSSESVKQELDEIEASVKEVMSRRANVLDIFKGRANIIGKDFVNLALG